MKRLAALIWLLALVPAIAQDNDLCMACHGQEGMGAPVVDATAYSKSIHGSNLCTACHTDAAEIPHPENLKPVSCARCHRLETQIYLTSDHGRAVAKGRVEAASCKDCHGHSHTLLNSRNPESPVNRKNIAQTCAKCHEDPARMGKARLTEQHPFVSYTHTIHGVSFAAGKVNSAVCSDCHGTHDLHGASNPQSRIYPKNIPNTCGRCHQNVSAVYNESIHGQAHEAGIKEAPVCTDCHGEHTILSPKDPDSSVYSGAITKTCSGCHESERVVMKLGLPLNRLKSYLDTYHGMAYQRGDLKVANCASCHGYHDVLPSTDPRSAVFKANLVNTCSRCHPGAGHQLTSGFVHGPPEGQHRILFIVKWFYLFLIPLVIGFMLFHNGLDFFRKMISGIPEESDAHADQERLTVNERIQHAVLMATFMLLAYSGFALQYHDAAWAQIFAPFGEEIRRGLHRWAALFFCALGAYHLLYLLGTKRGRWVLKEYTPRWADAKALVQHFAYVFGRREAPPPPSGFYSYHEKMEYWALVWGSIIMVVSGALLVFNNFTLKHFPLWMSDLADMVHFYEAVLACLAIVVWHLYLVIFDPKIYPMSWAWLTGKIRRKSSKPSSKHH